MIICNMINATPKNRGDKDTQSQDIQTAQRYWRDYRSRDDD